MGEIFDNPGLLLQFFNLLGILRKSKENNLKKTIQDLKNLMTLLDSFEG